MSARVDGCAVARWLRCGCAGGMALFSLAVAAVAAVAAATAPTAAPEAPAAFSAQETSAAAAQLSEAQLSEAPLPEAPAPAPDAARASEAGGEKMLPPCVPVRRTHGKHHKPKRLPALQTAALTGPPPPAPADTVVDAQVGEENTSLGSILGKDVKSPNGEDLGRVVDVLADARGRVRVAIIDFGGFLGVGTRRIAVDWPLLHFDPDSHDKPLVLSVDRQKLQSAPEYNSKMLRVLMPPAAADANDASQAKR